SVKHRGQYMALFSMAFSFSHIVAPALGMRIADNLGYSTLWVVLTIASGFAVVGYLMLGRMSSRQVYSHAS
ncbi:MAG: hypothetical protein KDC44_12580, partial [Phaeodactylibacter sp.]|nr:hypothetical protein [Phaeodactylibacter sp.]